MLFYVFINIYSSRQTFAVEIFLQQSTLSLKSMHKLNSLLCKWTTFDAKVKNICINSHQVKDDTITDNKTHSISLIIYSNHMELEEDMNVKLKVVCKSTKEILNHTTLTFRQIYKGITSTPAPL